MNGGASALSDVVGLRVGEYQITGTLGRGGMGTVFSGVHPLIGTEVAIKVIDRVLASDAQLVERFLQEARAVNRIRHPNIIEIFAFGDAPDIGHYYVMPRLHGCSLREKIQRVGPFSLEDSLAIFRQIAAALDAAHRAGVLHRDLKPDNVFLAQDDSGGETVKVLDFGLAKLIGGDAIATTHSGQTFGTPLFMSPEQWDGGALDHRADVYAFGVLTYFMLTGHYPFHSSSALELMYLHAKAPPPSVSIHGAPREVDAVIEKALAKKPANRFSSAGELCLALEGVASAMSLTSNVPARISPSAVPIDIAMAETVTAGGLSGVRPRDPKRLRWSLVAAVLVVLAGVTTVVSTRSVANPRRPTPSPLEQEAAEDAPAADSRDGTHAAPLPAPQVALKRAAATDAPAATSPKSRPAPIGGPGEPTARVAQSARPRRPGTEVSRAADADLLAPSSPGGESEQVAAEGRVATDTPDETATEKADSKWGETINPF